MKPMTSMGLKYDGAKLWVLDQTLLPQEEKWLECRTPEDMVTLIQRLAVRGAPLIGVAAALSLGVFAEKGESENELKLAALHLRAARPTAVNLMASIDRLLKHLSSSEKLLSEIEAIFDEDVALCEQMASRGAALIQDGDSILTHCNSGALATAGIGTALGVIRRAHEQKKKVHVYVDETRPLLQGARLTTWELGRLGIPYTLICDNMAGSLMHQGKIQRVFVGADRIAANGDAANKIGTYSLAVLARHHQIPFYVVAPKTTLDQNTATGSSIPIEQRRADEVRSEQSPANAQVWNPAFDVTPRALITNIIFNDEIW